MTSVYLTASIDKMLDCIELVFKWLEKFNLKIIHIKMPLLPVQHSSSSGIYSSAESISANPKKVEKVKIGQVPTNPKELQSYLGVGLLLPTILYQDSLQ